MKERRFVISLLMYCFLFYSGGFFRFGHAWTKRKNATRGGERGEGGQSGDDR